MANSKENFITLSDAYKYSHHKFYLPEMTRMMSYLESRGGKFDSTMFFGLQYFLKEYCTGQVITESKIQQANAIMPQIFGNNDVYDETKFRYILEKHGGRLPLEILAVPEGTVVPVGNALMTIENTDHSPEGVWLTNFVESLLLEVWYPITVGTTSNQVGKVIAKYFIRSASVASYPMMQYVLNDFGFRGTECPESAGLGGMAHLANSSFGSDNILASIYAMRHYNALKVYSASIPATEHSVMTLKGESGELDIMRRVLKQFPSGPLACVSDSFNIIRACKDYWGKELKEEILSRDGTLTIRPDSGDPIMTMIKVFEALFDAFGYTINEKGYKVLPPQVRVIQGDGVNYDEIINMYETITSPEHMISAENLFFGMGGALLQKLDRDTQKFAFKCCWAEVGGIGVNVQKSPTEIDKFGNSSKSFKKSKAGRLKLIVVDGEYKTVTQDNPDYLQYPNLLIPVFRNGELLINYSFEDVMNRANPYKI